jgi:hypothetical protein
MIPDRSRMHYYRQNGRGSCKLTTFNYGGATAYQIVLAHYRPLNIAGMHYRVHRVDPHQAKYK